MLTHLKCLKKIIEKISEDTSKINDLHGILDKESIKISENCPDFEVF